MTEVVVVGAGPSGCTAAMALASQNYSVTIYEAETLPRHKHCGGYLTKKAIHTLQSMGVDCRNELAQEIYGWKMQLGEKTLELELEKNDENLTGNVRREDFDYFLLEKARERGANVVDSTRVRRIQRLDGKNKCNVITDEGQHECDVVLGSDGIKSVIRRNLGINYPKEKLAVCIEAEVPVGKDVIDWFDSKNFISMNYFREGVTWAFPKAKGSTVNVGLGVSAREMKKDRISLTNALNKFLKDQEWYNNQITEPHIDVLPFNGTTDKLGEGRVLLLGDAAGLVDPLRGEGISHAITSGKFAAEAVKTMFEMGVPPLETYNELMKETLNEINVYGMRLHDYFYVKDYLKKFSGIIYNNNEMKRSILKLGCGLTTNSGLLRDFTIPKIILAYLSSLLIQTRSSE